LNLLAIDTACSTLSIAVSSEHGIFYAETEAGVRHSEIVMDMIDSQMKKTSLAPSGLDGVVCMGGPGSFTGLRIGYSIAKGLALSLSVPFISVPTLDCIASRHNGLVLSIIEARKNSWFFSVHRGERKIKPAVEAAVSRISDEIIKTAETENNKMILTGSGAASLFSSLSQEAVKHLIYNHESCGYAKELITVVKKQNLLNNDNSAILYSGPEYIRKTDAELNLR
jgi:tRNA threonylcarbamoyladenosine biosynthesis protein TsaB